MLRKFMTGLLVTGLALASSAFAQGKQIKVGVIFDMSGALAAGGSNASYLGTKYAIDMINERGGVEGARKLEPHLLEVLTALRRQERVQQHPFLRVALSSAAVLGRPAPLGVLDSGCCQDAPHRGYDQEVWK